MADVYLDACCFIYLVEGEPRWRDLVERRLRRLGPDDRLITSQLSRLECRMQPMRDGNVELLRRYDALFAAGRVSVKEITAAIVDRATALRAQHGFRTPDALHLASAIETGTSSLLTGDAALARCHEIQVEVFAPSAEPT